MKPVLAKALVSASVPEQEGSSIDTGDLLLQRSLEIGADETTGELYERLMKLGANTAVEAIKLIEAGQLSGTPQDESLVSHAPKIFHEDCRIDWSASAKTCHNFIRGMSPYPGAWTVLDGKELKILRSATIDLTTPLAPAHLVPLAVSETSFGESPGLGISTGAGGVIHRYR